MFEYNMTETMAKELIKAEKKKKISDKQQFLIDTINESFGLLYPVSKVNITL